MAVKIRLQRHGKKNFAFFHIVVADARSPRDGRYIEQIGSYNPNTNPATIVLDGERALAWLNVGAEPTLVARRILSYEGVLLKKHLAGGVAKGALTQEQADKKFADWKAQRDAKIEAKKLGLDKAAADKAKVENYKELGLNSETAVMFNITSREQVIVNTWYGGEMKKGMFSMMNYYLPLKGIASMHCSANTDLNGKNTAIFFGLSGTGKTTLSTDPKRLLIGDDEHGWDDNGVFNFEGGCYAKVINLDKDSEPDIYNAIRRDALLENVTLDKNGKIDFADKSVTENTRVSYPIDHIKNIVRPVSAAPDAKSVIFLSADAFGVLPPVSILTPEQTQYYFLSGFTAKLAGTERGITEPTPTFSACFGQAFLELHPTKYAEELVKKMNKSGAKAYLVNTGWNGTGKRISIKDTRGIIDAILSGAIDKAPTKKIPYFDFEVPTELPGVDSGILDPRDTYADVKVWNDKAVDLAGRFIKNFAKYEGNEAGKALVKAGPKI